jgi:hypothetical protein
MEFFSVAVPRSESELSVMVSMLIAYEIPYFVHNRGFGGLYPGMQVPLYNIQRVMVPLAYREDAMNLFLEFRDSYDDSFTNEKLRIGDRIRGLVELIFCGWAVPFRHRKFSRLREGSEDD